MLRCSDEDDVFDSYYGPYLYEVRSKRNTCLSPHGALRAYTVFLTDRASPRLSAYVTSSVSGIGRTSPRCEARGILAYHRMAHFVLIRCFLQPSLAEALCLCNFFSIRDRSHFYEVRSKRNTCLSPHGALRAYTVFLTDRASPRLSAYVTFSVSGIDRTSPMCEARGILAYHRMAHFVLTLSYIQMKVSDFL